MRHRAGCVQRAEFTERLLARVKHRADPHHQDHPPFQAAPLPQIIGIFPVCLYPPECEPCSLVELLSLQLGVQLAERAAGCVPGGPAPKQDRDSAAPGDAPLRLRLLAHQVRDQPGRAPRLPRLPRAHRRGASSTEASAAMPDTSFPSVLSAPTQSSPGTAAQYPPRH